MEHITVKEILEATGGTLLCGDVTTPLNHISIDSRTMKGQDLFVPLVGEKVDAHRFIAQAFESGAVATLTSEHDVEAVKALEEKSDHPWIRVDDTKTALQAIGGYYRRKLDLPLVGITGSVGKTTTREMVAEALTAGFQVYRTPGNSNSQVGVPITLSEITAEDQIGVIELGMSEPGELTVIAKLAQIDAAVITNVGITHIEQLGSQENIYREKISIQDGLKAGGTLFLNADDPLLAATEPREGFHKVTYGTAEGADYRAVDVHTEDGYPAFTAVHGEMEIPVRLHILGNHNVLNAMAALAVADTFHVPLKAAAKSLEGFTGFKNRQKIYDKDGIKIIDDTYNASPVSMKAGLDVLGTMKAERKIAVLADMKELGPDSPRFHYEVGTYIGEHPINEVVVLGELAKNIGQGVLDADKGITVHMFPETEREQMVEYLKNSLKSGDCVLFKGSNSMKLGEIAAMFI